MRSPYFPGCGRLAAGCPSRNRGWQPHRGKMGEAMAFRMRPVWGAVLAAAVVCGWAAGAIADSPKARYFRIGTGGIAGTYFPVGSLIAEGLTRSAAEADCGDAALCGVPGLIAVAQTSNGSVANVRAVAAGELEAALVQADVATWAQRGEGAFGDDPRLAGLRAVAALYPESLHVVVRGNLRLRSIADLRGRRVSLDEPGSGTLIDSRVILAAFGLGEADLRPEYVKPSLAAARMVAGQLDGFMIIAGHPVASIMRLGWQMPIDLLPIDREVAEAIAAGNPFFRPSVIPAGTYAGIGETPTLDVTAQLVVDAGLDEPLVHAVTRALWGGRIQRLFREGHPKGRQIALETALDGVAIPLHDGAARYYREIGMLPPAGGGRSGG